MRLPGWLGENFWLKVISLVIAVLLWLFVRVEEKAEVVLRLPVRFLDVPEELVMIGDPVAEIQVVVEGPRTLVSQVERNIQPYTIDLGDAEPGVQQIRIQADRISLPRGVEVVRIVPAVIEFELRRVQHYRLAVQARLKGEVAPGYEIGDVEIEPAVVEIDVAEGQLDGVQAIATEPIEIEGLKSDWSGVVPLDLDGLDVKSVTAREVSVFIRIVPTVVERTFAAVPVVVRGPGGPYRTQPETIRLRLMGPELVVRNLDSGSLTGYVELSELLQRPTELPVRVELPDHVVLLEVAPPKVRVLPKR